MRATPKKEDEGMSIWSVLRGTPQKKTKPPVRKAPWGWGLKKKPKK